MRDGNPITGEVWVVDENNHCVASFRIKRRQCHLAGATEDIIDAGLNLSAANALIGGLTAMWLEESGGAP